MADDAVVGEVESWFQTRGFALSTAHVDGSWWAILTRIDNPASVIERYGRDETAGGAAQRARERWTEEQPEFRTR
jgi:hypothetical protein